MMDTIFSEPERHRQTSFMRRLRSSWAGVWSNWYFVYS